MWPIEKIDMKINKNEKLLKEFSAYCAKYPELRFWQALRNWAGVGYVYFSNDTPGNSAPRLVDTFFFENKNN